MKKTKELNKAWKSEIKKAKKHMKKAAALIYDYYMWDNEYAVNESELDKKECACDEGDIISNPEVSDVCKIQSLIEHLGNKLFNEGYISQPIKDEGGCSYNYKGDDQHDLDRFL